MSLSDDDKELRRRGVTGTDMADLIEGRVMDVFLRKQGLADVEETEAMHWGQRLERAVGEEYGDRHPPVLLFAGRTRQHPSRPWHVGTPDFEVVDPISKPMKTLRGLEIKCRSGFSVSDWESVDGLPSVPLRVEAQVRWYAALCDLGEWDVAVLFNGNRYGERRVTRDLAIEADMLQIGEDFYTKHILAATAPDPDGSKKYSDYLKRRFACRTEDIIEATDDDDELAWEWRARASQVKADERRIEAIKQQLMLRVGSGSGLRLRDGTIVPRRGRTAYTVPARDVGESTWIELPRKWRSTKE